MKDNWKALGDKVKTELDQQQAPIPDFKEFVKYSNTVNTPSARSGYGSSIGPGILKVLPLLIIAGALTIFCPKIKSARFSQTESDPTKTEVKTINSLSAISESIKNTSVATSNIVNEFDAKNDVQVKVGKVENSPKTGLSSSNNIVNIGDTTSDIVSKNKKEGINNNSLVPSNYSTALSATTLLSNTSTSSNTVIAQSEINNIQNIKAISSGNENSQKNINSDNIPVHMVGSDYEMKDNQVTANDLETKIIFFQDSNSQKNVNNPIAKTAIIDNQSLGLVGQVKKERSTTLLMQPIAILPLLPLFTDNKNNVTTPLKDLGLSYQEIRPVFPSIKISHSFFLGVNANDLNSENINVHYGYLISKPIFSIYGIGIQTGLRYQKNNSTIRTQWLETYSDPVGFAVVSETNSQDSSFHMIEVPLEITWNVLNNNRLKLNAGIAHQWIVASKGEYERITMFSNGTSTAASNGGTSRDFKRRNMSATFGMEFYVNSHISIGGSYNRAISNWLKTFQPNNKTENFNGGASGNLKLDNGRIYVRYQL